MQTPIPLTPASALRHAAPATKQGYEAAPATQFNQVLSRQMNEHPNSTANKPLTRGKDTAAETAHKPVTSKAAAKSSGQKDKTSESTDESDKNIVSLPTASMELMALVAQFAQQNAKPTTQDTVHPVQADSSVAINDATENAGKQLAALNPSTPPEATLTINVRNTNANDIAANQILEQPGRPGKPDLQKAQPELSSLPASDIKPEALPEFSNLAITPEPLPSLATALLQQIPLDVLQSAGSRPAEKLTPHVGTPAWDQALGQKIVWMVGGAQQSASLTLNPPDLGPLQVVLNVSNEQANATFISAQPEVRQAIEAALPKLREMMSEAGIQLGQANVNSGNGGQQGPTGEQNRPSATHFTRGKEPVDPSATIATETGALSRAGLVNTFA